MTREARFGLFLAGVMLLSMAGAAASADPKIHTARSVERSMARTRQQLADEQARKAAEQRREADEQARRAEELKRELDEAADRNGRDLGWLTGDDSGAKPVSAGPVGRAPCAYCTR